MASSRWVDIPGTANILKISQAEVMKKIQNGEFVTQKNGNTTEIQFIFDPKKTPKYTLVKPTPPAPATTPAPTKPDEPSTTVTP